MPDRQAIAKIANVAFLVFFALYTAGSIIWLLAGVPPILAGRVPAVHETLHRWGAGDHGYVVASKRGLEQRASAASRRVPAQELAVRAGTQVVIWFENDDRGVLHNLAIYEDHGVRRVFQGPTTVGPARTEIVFAAPGPGTYLVRDELHPSQPAQFVVVESDRQIPAWVRWVPGLRTAAAGAAIDSHMVKPASEVILQYLFSALNLGLGILLIRVRPHDLAARLLALGMIGTAAVFNFQAHSGLEELPGLALKLHDNYHLFAGLAYVYALLVFPDGKLARSWSRPRWFKWPLRALYLVAITAVVFLNRSRLHGDPTGFVLFFGILIPIAGVTSQVFRLRQASSAAQREQSRVLVWALTLALVTGPLAQRRQRPRRPRITPNTTTATTTMISTHNHVDMAASLIGAGAGQADATAGHPSKQLPASRRPPGPGSTAALRAGSRGPLHPARPARRSGLARRMPARPRPCRATAARS